MIDFEILDPNDFHNLDETEKEKYVQSIIEAIQKTNNQIIKKMANIVKRNVKHYRNDFYVHDLYLIQEHEGPFLWMTRDTGTDFIPLRHLKSPLVEWYHQVKYVNTNFYYYDGHYLRKIDFNEMEKVVNKYKKLLTSQRLVDTL